MAVLFKLGILWFEDRSLKLLSFSSNQTVKFNVLVAQEGEKITFREENYIVNLKV